MKKLSLILVFALMVGLLAGCAGTPVIYYTECNCPEGGQTAVTPAPAPQETPSDTPAAEGALKTGLHISANVKDSKSATADENAEAYGPAVPMRPGDHSPETAGENAG